MKKGKSQFQKQKRITDYEKKRLDNLKFNASKMKEMGLGTLANKILASKYESTAKKIMSEGDLCLDRMDLDDVLSEDREYQPSETEDGEEGEEMDLVPNPTPTIKGLNQQKISMVELAMARRNRKKLPPNQQQTIPSEKGVEEEEMVVQNSALEGSVQQTISMAELAMARSKKKRPLNQQEPVQQQRKKPSKPASSANNTAEKTNVASITTKKGSSSA